MVWLALNDSFTDHSLKKKNLSGRDFQKTQLRWSVSKRVTIWRIASRAAVGDFLIRQQRLGFPGCSENWLDDQELCSIPGQDFLITR